MRKLIALLIGSFALVLVSTVRAQNTSGVNNAELTGDYAFTFNGITGGSGPSSVFAAVGRFTADGAGNVTNGELDNNGVGTGASVAQPFTGTYAIGADHRGVMTLAGIRLAFAMMANGNAQFIEFDAGGGSGRIGSGTMEKVDTTAYNTVKITGDYAFGAAGLDNLNNRAAIAGRFTSNGTGTLTNPVGDFNAYGTDYAMNFTAANYTVSDSATGRGTMSLSFSFGGAPANLNFVFYVVNAGKLFAMERDTVTTSTPLLNGVVLRQQGPAGGFSNASLYGNTVIYLTGLSTGCSGVGGGGVPKTVAGLLTADGNGAFNLTFDENFCSAPRSVTGAAGTYSVTGNGRTSITFGGYSLVAYLVSLNQMLLFVTDPNVLFGFGEPQAPGSFTNSAVNGRYAGFTSNPVTFDVVVLSGEFTADGASPTGNITGTQDIGASSGPVPGVAFNATYSISSSPTNGRGTMSVTSGDSAAIYVISSSKFVAVPLTEPKPAILIFEQSSPPSTTPGYTLSASPTSFTITQGGSGTSTISVTPQNGFRGSVSLSASGLPSGVTASFSPNPTTTSSTLTLTAGSAATTGTVTVTITSTSGTLTNTTTITLTVTSPPLPTVSSLQLNPSSVVGGAQSSTGTVTLSGPAPAGGAQVLLSSSNAAATVPSSATVPAGATSATFPVNTSMVLVSTSADISASYNGTTRTATLTIWF